MSEKDDPEAWRRCIKIALNCEKWADHLETRGEHEQAAAIRRAANEYRAKAKRLRPDSRK